MTEAAAAIRLPWQEQQWLHLVELHQQNTLPHAILLAGPQGIGKQRFAEAFTQYLLCESPRQNVACGECRQCGFIQAGSHPDLKWIAPEERGKQIKIDQVRALVESLGHTAQQSGYKVVVLAPAEAMNINAANALLKSLEEPAAKTLLVLISDAQSQLLPTIRSRCQVVGFPLPSMPIVKDWLATLAPASTSLELLYEEAAGQPMTALELLSDDGLERRQQLMTDFSMLLSGRLSALALAEKWQQYDLRDILYWLANKFSGLLARPYVAEEGEVAAGVAELFKHMPLISARNLFALLDQVTNLRVSLERGANPNKLLALESLLLECCEKNHS
ncbi:DNA polymerase III subunit delta' [Oceanicoccus sp. KOV_DT_Chl]|uniref:DNA polymerase III subunit delta' n=1 Tax=Oceanicoccus sp. KOV_DT_Chl TaxID=1904639 RepID=UPI000C7B8B2E|nr:DNA polymerase III subunit delta' [Oceanicoccus sp. KOV_DT_Chl]